jgi:hypothetical protein
MTKKQEKLRDDIHDIVYGFISYEIDTMNDGIDAGCFS